MKTRIKHSIARAAGFYRANTFTVWFFLISWFALSVISSHKDVLYFSVNEEYSAEPWRVYAQGFLLWTIAACFAPLVFKLAQLFSVHIKKNRRRNLFLHLIFSICFLFVLTPVFSLIFYLMFPQGYAFTAHFSWNIYWYSFGIPVVYWFMIGSLFLRQNILLYNERRQKAVALRSELKEIQLKVLQAQLRPHFLFNALNTVSALIFEDHKAAVGMLKKIRRYLELSMKETDKTAITLGEELYYTKLYLEIEKERYSDRLQVRQQIEPDIKQALVPNMLLQPLVENAVRHGIAREKGAGKLLVRAKRKENRLLLEVEDSGKGFDEFEVVRKEGLGIKNTIERLQKLYPGEYTFDISDSPLGGAKVSVVIPYVTTEYNYETVNTR